MYTVQYSKIALKTLAKMPKTIATRFVDSFKLIASGNSANLDIKHFEGAVFRFRIGGWRAVYTVDDGKLLVVVVKIAPRGDVYK